MPIMSRSRHGPTPCSDHVVEAGSAAAHPSGSGRSAWKCYTSCMSAMITVRLDESLVAEIDRERKRGAMSRARVIKDALALWVERRKIEAAVRRDRLGYERLP